MSEFIGETHNAAKRNTIADDVGIDLDNAIPRHGVYVSGARWFMRRAAGRYRRGPN
jgi:hypothetical protein